MNKLNDKQEKFILDACCGSRMFWFDKENKDTEFMDIRKEEHVLCDGRELIINPTTIGDFTKMPFADKSYKLVVFDPPHLDKIGDNAWIALKYGKLTGDWKEMIRNGFSECFRVLDDYGVLIFKWNEIQIPTSEILNLTDQKPLIGHKSGKMSDTHWITFMKVPHNNYLTSVG